MGSFFIIELLACKAGLDFKGFTKYQMAKQEKYDRLLIELGERSYLNFGMNLPVEVRLVGMIFIDAGIFFVAKYAVQMLGPEMGMVFSAMFGVPLPTPTIQQKPRMRGPSMRPEDIRNMRNKVE
jgi:hypothetical protein